LRVLLTLSFLATLVAGCDSSSSVLEDMAEPMLTYRMEFHGSPTALGVNYIAAFDEDLAGPMFDDPATANIYEPGPKVWEVSVPWFEGYKGFQTLLFEGDVTLSILRGSEVLEETYFPQVARQLTFMVGIVTGEDVYLTSQVFWDSLTPPGSVEMVFRVNGQDEPLQYDEQQTPRRLDDTRSTVVYKDTNEFHLEKSQGPGMMNFSVWYRGGKHHILAFIHDAPINVDFTLKE